MEVQIAGDVVVGQGGQDPASTRRWWTWVGVWSALGLAIRLAVVFSTASKQPVGDAFFYHYEANLIAAGKGFINPFLYFEHIPHEVVKTASFPPGFVFVLTAASLVGFKSFLAQRIWCCIVGAAGIAVCAAVGRDISGRRAGLIAAFLVAVYPNIWMSDPLALSETLSPVIVAVVLLFAYRFWRNPSLRGGFWLGLCIGAAALARDELALLGLFVLVPAAIGAHRLAPSARLKAFAAGCAGFIVVVGPWVGYNMSRFTDPVFVSTGFGVTLASANCASTWSGPYEGYWSMPCALAVPVNPHVDESVQGSTDQAYAMRFIQAHLGRFPVVAAARIGRTFGLYRPIQQIQLDSAIEKRPYHWALVGLFMYYAMLGLSVVGVVLMRRRSVPVYPLVAVGLTVVVAVVISFGQTRFRSTFEISLVLWSAVALEAAWARVASTRAVPAG